jgi:hypothetical protein
VTVYGKECETTAATRSEEREARAFRHDLDKLRADHVLRQHQVEENSCGPDSPRRAGIRERIEQALYANDRTRQRAAIAIRAKQIIDQHPEFAELLDLLNDL